MSSCVDQQDIVHLVMFDAEGVSVAGVCWCGSEFVWNFQAHLYGPNPLEHADLIVRHADGRSVTCIGCIAAALG